MSQVVQMAYAVPQNQIVGPDWLLQQRFAIQGKILSGFSKDDVPKMMQRLLVERFGLVAHHEQRMVPVYAMTLAKGGPKFQEAKADNSAIAPCMLLQPQ